MTISAAAARWAGVGTAVLLVAGATAALVLDDRGDGQGDEQVAANATTSSTEETTTTTTTATTVPPSSTTSISVAVLKVTTTTTAKPTTTTTGRATFSISPTSGPQYTSVTARGAGCTGATAGVSITHYTPSGKPYNGDGASARPDGTWEVPMSIGAPEGPGRYRLVAECTGGDRRFAYAPQYFTVTG